MSQVTPHKTLLYDGHCPMCCNAVNALKQWKLLNGVQALPWDESGLQDKALEARIRSELLLRDDQTGQVWGGFQVITELMSLASFYQAPLYPGLGLAVILKWPPVAWAGERVYKTIALNRRLLSPPNTGGLACACDPPFHPGYRVLLIGVLLLLNLVGCYSFVAGAKPVWLALLGSALFWNFPFLLLWLVCLLFLFKRVLVVVEQSLVLMGMMGLALMVFNSLLALLMRFNMMTVQMLDPALMIYCLLMYWALFYCFRKRSQALALPFWVPIFWLFVSFGFPIFLLNVR